MANEMIDIVDHIEAVVTTEAAINSFIYDDISALNGFHETDYPCLILKPATILVPNIKKQDDDYQLDMFLYDLYQQDEQKTKKLAQKWSDLQLPLYRVLAAIQDKTKGYHFTNQAVIDPGHDMHNDSLIGLRARVTMRVPACRV